VDERKLVGIYWVLRSRSSEWTSSLIDRHHNDFGACASHVVMDIGLHVESVIGEAG
jgi:hypothetical protein